MALLRFRLRGDTAADWTAANPILADREPGVETDTGRMKLGDGVRAWNSLDYVSKGATGATGPAGEGLRIVGTGTTTADLPASAAPGDGWVIGSDLYVWPSDGSGWTDAGPIRGPKGDTGPTGPQGPKGDTGAAGPQGPQGIQGSKGDTGATGARGPIGPAGLTWRGTWSSSTDYVLDDAVYYNGSSWFASGDPTVGEVPATGATHWQPLALQGATGPQGAKGDTGAQGPTGATGPQGAAATVDIGTTTTGNPGTSASVTNSGSTGAAVFNFVVPQGPTGATGAQGPKGDTGATGPTGPTGPGVAPGGSAEQVLTKNSATNYDTGWQTLTANVTRVYYAGAVPARPSGATYVEWVGPNDPSTAAVTGDTWVNTTGV